MYFAVCFTVNVRKFLTTETLTSASAFLGKFMREVPVF